MINEKYKIMFYQTNYIEYDKETFYNLLKPYLLKKDYIIDSYYFVDPFSINFEIKVFTLDNYKIPYYTFKIELENEEEFQEWKNSTIVPQNNQLLK